MTFQKQFSLAASGFANDEKAQLKTNLIPYSDRNATGIYLKKGEQITIDVSGQFVNARVATESGFSGLGAKSVGSSFVTTLGNGTNHFVAQNDGILYLENNSLSQAATVQITAPDTVEKTILITKNNTAQDVQRMLAENPTAKAVEIQGDRILLTVSYESAKTYLKDPQALIKRWEEILNAEDNVAGLSANTNGVNQISKDVFHGVEYSSDMWMFATHNLTGYSYGAADITLSADKLKADGWGPWHEIGHQHQVSAMTWDSQTEVTENIYALFVNYQMGSPIQSTHLKPVSQFFKEKPEMATQDYNQWELHEKLTMFAQMNLAFGKVFYQNLHQYYRMLTSEESPKTMQEKMDHLVIATSKISGYDLSAFYEAWRLPYTPAVKAQVAALGLKALPLDLANFAVSKSDGTDAAPLGLYKDLYIVPDATPHHGLMVKAGTALTPEDLISYDKSKIKSATFAQPLDVSQPGVENAMILIEDYQGHKNIIPVQVLLVPKNYANTSEAEILSQIQKELLTIVDHESAITNIASQIELLQFVKQGNAAELMGRANNYAKQNNGKIAAFLETLNAEDMVQDGGFAKLKISTTQLAAIKQAGSLDIQMFVDGKYASSFEVKSSGVTRYYAAKLDESADGNTYFYSGEAPLSSGFGKIEYVFSFTPKDGGAKTGSSLSASPADFGKNVAYDVTVIADNVFVNQINGAATLVFEKAFYQEVKKDGDLSIKMFVNGQYQGEISEVNNAESSYYASAYKETSKSSLFVLNNKNILPTDKVSFELSYKENGSTKVQQKTLQYDGSDLGYFSELKNPPATVAPTATPAPTSAPAVTTKVTLADVMANMKVEKYSSKFAGVSFAKSFYNQMEKDGDATIKMYVNNKYVGEVSELNNAESSYYAGSFAQSTTSANFYINQLGIKSTDQIRFEVNYKQNGQATSTQNLNITGEQAGFAPVTPPATVAPTPAPTSAPVVSSKVTLADVVANLKVSKIDGKFAGITFTKEFYAKMENGGDSIITMTVNGKQIGAVVETGGAEKQHSSGKFAETASQAQFYINQLDIKSTDQFSFNVFYKAEGTAKYATKMVKFTGADLLTPTAKMMAVADDAQTEITVVDQAVAAPLPAKADVLVVQNDKSNAIKLSSLLDDDAGLTVLVKADPNDGHAQSSQKLYEGGQTWSNISRFDLNHDNVIDAKDAVFAELKVWHDQNHDMLLTDNELNSLNAVGVQSLGLVDHVAASAVSTAAKAIALGDVQFNLEAGANANANASIEPSTFTVL